jgi:sensor domain CHASE-containing protein
MSDDLIKRIRYVGAGLLVSIAVLAPGAIWFKEAVSSMAQTSANEISDLLKVRINVLRQQMSTELAVAHTNLAFSNVTSNYKLKRDLPFDLVALFDRDRKLIDGYRILSANKSIVELNNDLAKHLIPADSGLFDQVTSSVSPAGIMLVDGRPMLIALRGFSVSAQTMAQFAVVGRWLDGRRLASNGEQAESRIELFSLSMQDNVPPDIQNAIILSERNSGFTYELDRFGEGHVYVLVHDIRDRPAVMAKVPWSLPWKNSGMKGFNLFYLSALVAGLLTWFFLTWNDASNRKRVRRFDGLSSLKPDHIKSLVEAFPGYSFAIKSNLEYVGVSRILAGVTGHEPSFFVGQRYGAIASEDDEGGLLTAFSQLRDPLKWPRTLELHHSIVGLGERHNFIGLIHYLAKQDVMLVILSHVEIPSSDLKQSATSHIETSNHPNSAVA